VTFFSYEWSNPRAGKKVKFINLKSSEGETGKNAIILLAISITETPAMAKAKGTENNILSINFCKNICEICIFGVNISRETSSLIQN